MSSSLFKRDRQQESSPGAGILLHVQLLHWASGLLRVYSGKKNKGRAKHNPQEPQPEKVKPVFINAELKGKRKTGRKLTANAEGDSFMEEKCRLAFMVGADSKKRKSRVKTFCLQSTPGGSAAGEPLWWASGQLPEEERPWKQRNGLRWYKHW